MTLICQILPTNYFKLNSPKELNKDVIKKENQKSLKNDYNFRIYITLLINPLTQCKFHNNSNTILEQIQILNTFRQLILMMSKHRITFAMTNKI